MGAAGSRPFPPKSTFQGKIALPDHCLCSNPHKCLISFGCYPELRLLSVTLVPVSWAGHVACGDMITSSTTLDTDVGPCATNPALTVVGPAQLDLGGKTVSCTSVATIGILLTGQGAKLRNGVVSGCDVGVRLAGTGRHRVERVLATGNNVGFSLLSSSERNTLKENAATDNMGGFLLDGDRATATDNTATGNSGNGFESFFTDRLTLRGNTAADNGARGFITSGTNHRYTKNVAQQNGGDGFHLFSGSSGYTLTQNRASDNGGNGIENSATDSKFVKNTVLGQSLDIVEAPAGCDGNTYRKNIFGTANQICVE